MILRWLNQIFTLRHLDNARWLAIGHPMALGDVVAVLPLAGILKSQFPHLNICFVGRPYVKPLIDCCVHIDRFLDFQQVIQQPALLTELGVDIFLNPFPHQELAVAACRAAVPIRVGNLRRKSIIPYCNRFVLFGRRKSGRHEISLNLVNLGGLGLSIDYPLAMIPQFFGLSRLPVLDAELASLLEHDKLKIIFHPKSNKNGREWPAEHFLSLAEKLPQDRFQIFVTGIAREGEVLGQEVPALFNSPNVTNLCGRLDLQQFLALISRVDGMVASGTGPLHVAAAMGKHALGIFPPRDDIDPAHWAPIGEKGEYLCLDERCTPGANRCPVDFPGGACACTAAIAPEQAMERIMFWSR